MKYRHSSKLFRLDAEMLKVFPGEDTGWGRSAASIAAPAKETLNAIVSFFLFRYHFELINFSVCVFLLLLYPLHSLFFLIFKLFHFWPVEVLSDRLI